MTDTTTDTTEPDQTAYLVTYHDPFVDQFRAVPDEAPGSVLTFAEEATAWFYASRLAAHDLIVRTQPATPAEVNEILRYNEVPLDETAAERVRMLEAQTTDELDLEQWAAEHADRFVDRLAKEYGIADMPPEAS